MRRGWQIGSTRDAITAGKRRKRRGTSGATAAAAVDGVRLAFDDIPERVRHGPLDREPTAGSDPRRAAAIDDVEFDLAPAGANHRIDDILRKLVEMGAAAGSTSIESCGGSTTGEQPPPGSDDRRAASDGDRAGPLGLDIPRPTTAGHRAPSGSGDRRWPPVGLDRLRAGLESGA